MMERTWKNLYMVDTSVWDGTDPDHYLTGTVQSKSGLLVLTRSNMAGSASRTNRILCNGSEVSCFSIHRRAFLAAYNDACIFPDCGVNVIVWECEIQLQCFTLIAVVLVISAIVLWPVSVSILHITFLTWPMHWSDPEMKIRAWWSCLLGLWALSDFSWKWWLSAAYCDRLLRTIPFQISEWIRLQPIQVIWVMSGHEKV
jgi:hypothetical protein